MAAPITTPRMQRTTGTARVSFRAGRLDQLAQQGSAKAITLPGPEVVFLNTSGGLTGGDRLTYRIETDTDTTATTQTAERAYRSTTGEARLDVDLRVEGRATLAWLPQETILFDNSDLVRATTISLGAEASVLALESIILGRKAMGESVRTFSLRDTRRIVRAGQPVVLEPLHLTPATLDGTATLAGKRALASLVLVAQGAEDALGPVRAALGRDGVTGAASALPGRLMVRLMADDGWPLRQQVLALLGVLHRAPLPRVWQA